jgi:predicted nucleic acid-binding protein
VTAIIHQAQEHVALTAAIEQLGIKAVDALHLALAEAAQVDYFCTCDDRFYRRALDVTDLQIKIRGPLDLAQEIAV